MSCRRHAHRPPLFRIPRYCSESTTGGTAGGESGDFSLGENRSVEAQSWRWSIISLLDRGPLAPDWFEQLKKTARKDSIMCAYKLCRVEFRYWGMQSKCERFIHEIGKRDREKEDQSRAHSLD